MANIRDEDLTMCCTKSSSITQAGSEVDFLLSPKATGRKDNCFVKRAGTHTEDKSNILAILT